MVGERIKSARAVAGLNQRALAQAVGVSAMAISKYERNLDMPGSIVFSKLAKALNVNFEYFFRQSSITKWDTPFFRCKKALNKKEENEIFAKVRIWLEKYLEIESLLEIKTKFINPFSEDSINSFNYIEKITTDLREKWELGTDSIENLTELLEEKGIKVGTVDGPNEFDGLALMVNNEMPVIVCDCKKPGDRQRFSLAHELAHILFRFKNFDEKEIEKAAHRFAGSFLVPKDTVIKAVGDKRKHISLNELEILKHQYGLSMMAWIYRLEDLNIISSLYAQRLRAFFNKYGWDKTEPGKQYGAEKSSRMEKFVFHSLSENIISSSKASEILDIPISEVLDRWGRL